MASYISGGSSPFTVVMEGEIDLPGPYTNHEYRIAVGEGGSVRLVDHTDASTSDGDDIYELTTDAEGYLFGTVETPSPDGNVMRYKVLKYDG